MKITTYTVLNFSSIENIFIQIFSYISEWLGDQRFSDNRGSLFILSSKLIERIKNLSLLFPKVQNKFDNETPLSIRTCIFFDWRCRSDSISSCLTSFSILSVSSSPLLNMAELSLPEPVYSPAPERGGRGGGREGGRERGEGGREGGRDGSGSGEREGRREGGREGRTNGSGSGERDE